MTQYTIVSDRKMSNCAGADRYIELAGISDFEDLWDLIDTGVIIKINDSPITINGKSRNFKILDAFNNQKFDANIGKYDTATTQKRWLRIGKYSDSVRLTPEQIIILFMEIRNSNCFISIKSLTYYKHIFKRIPRETNVYVLEASSCEHVDELVHLDTFLRKFNIFSRGNTYTLGKNSPSYQGYIIEGATKEFVGIPFSPNLEIVNFNAEDLE